jgi:hypothetical protein
VLLNSLLPPGLVHLEHLRKVARSFSANLRRFRSRQRLGRGAMIHADKRAWHRSFCHASPHPPRSCTL